MPYNICLQFSFFHRPNKLNQFKQIAHTKSRSSRRNQDKFIRGRCICPPCFDGSQHTLVICVINSVFTPAAIVLNKIKLTSEQGMKLMDYPEPLFMILRIERS